MGECKVLNKYIFFDFDLVKILCGRVLKGG